VKKFIIPFLIMAVFGACSANKNVVNTELGFANKLAAQGLWKEARYRWEKVLEAGKENAAIYNNIAISLETAGDFKEADVFYKKALKLAPNNSTIKDNYEKFQKYLKNEDAEVEEDRNKNDKKKNGKKRDI